MEIYKHGQSVDGLVWNEIRECWYTRHDFEIFEAKAAKEIARAARAAKKEEKAEARRIEQAWILINYSNGLTDRGQLTLAYRDRFGKSRAKVTTLPREICGVLNAAGIRLKGSWTSQADARRGTG